MSRKQKKVFWRIIISACLMAALHFVPAVGILRFTLYLVPYAIIGWDILLKAFKGIINRQPTDECFLMAVATVGAMALGLFKTGDYAEAVFVMLFYQVGELFQGVAVRRSRKSISELMDIRPDYANIERGGETVQVDPADVHVGDIITVRPGEKIPIDGVVEQGESSLNTSALTGESLPRDVKSGDEVVSGCINMTGVLYVRTTRDFGESTVSKILELAENAVSVKAKPERFVARFARVYTPAVCIAAVALAILPPAVLLIAGKAATWGAWLYRALTFLVISCPCALVISIPLTFFAGIGGISRKGILIKGASYLEELGKTQTAVFDKTGTLTKGEFSVAKVFASEGFSENELLMYAAAAESASPHPIAKGIVKYCNDNGITVPAAFGITERIGRGVVAMTEGKQIAVGNLQLMQESGAVCSAVGGSGAVVYTAVDGCYAGYIEVCDSVKPDAADAVGKLKKLGVKKTVMLSGDRSETALAVGSMLGLDEIHARLLPEDKADKLQCLLKNKPKDSSLVYVGDGINDAPVLAMADVGIAMGALGSDAAVDAADVVIMDDGIGKIPVAIAHSKKTMRIVRQNIIFSIAVKLACLVLSALGLADMTAAVFADVGVMVLAVLNAMRALRV